MKLLFAGTFDLQNITVSLLMISGTVDVHLEYARNSSTRGCFLILSQGQYTGYFSAKKQRGRDDQTLLLKGLPRGDYIISGYDVKNTSLDNVPPAVVLDGVTLDQGTAFWNQGVCPMNTAQGI